MTNGKISAGTIARTIVLALALFNQFMVMTGHKMIEIADDDIYQVVSLIFTIGASVWAWWKNNSFTKSAIMADEVMTKINSRKNESDPTLSNIAVFVTTCGDKHENQYEGDPAGDPGPIGGPKEGENHDR